MKKTLLFSLFAVGFFVSMPSCGKKTEKTGGDSVVSDKPKFTSDEGNFKIAFPGEPTFKTEVVPTELGDIEMKAFTYEYGQDAAYMVAYSDYPVEAVEAGDKNLMLQGAKEGVIGNMEASIEEEKDIEIDGNPGVYFKAKSKNFATVYKIFLVRNRLYQIGIIKAGTYPADSDIKSFLDSFELIRK